MMYLDSQTASTLYTSACSTNQVICLPSGEVVWIPPEQTYLPLPPYWHPATLTTTSNVTTSPYSDNIYFFPTISNITSTTFITDPIISWPNWHDTIAAPNLITERAEAEQARFAAYELECQQERERQRAIEERAKQIFLEHLTPEQRNTIEKNGWFMIEGGKTGKRYRIRNRSIAGNVEELNDQGLAIARYCCHLSTQYPEKDHHLTQKLMLEWDEDEFLRRANRTAITPR